MDTILDEFIRKHPGSASRYEEANEVFAGGVTHDSRYMTPFPLCVTHGKGPRKWDVDGNEYLDYVSGHGSLILGHSHPEIVSTVANQVARGTHLGANTDEELRWVKAIKALMPSVDKVRFHSSGTEATLMALRLCRAYTGKDKIIKFAEHFHGWHDYVIAKGDTPVAGVPATTTQSVIVLPPDISAVEDTLSRDDNIAAVIVEAIGSYSAFLPLPLPRFLKDLREVTKKHNVLMIMDEVVTGFRVSRGGAQSLYGVEPDLSTMAKIVAGGLPGGVVGGKADIIDMIAFRNDPEWNAKRRVAHQGTFNANPMSAAAGAKALEIIASEPINERANAMAARLKKGLNDIFSKMEVPGHARGTASIVHLTMADCDCDRGICNMPHQQIKDAGSVAVTVPLKRAMINAGVDIMGRGTLLVGATHQEKDIDQTIGAFEQSLTAMRKEGIV